jgi:hypothetical protein
MRDKNKLYTTPYRLHDGFNTELTIKEIIPMRSPDSTEDDSFRLKGVTDKGNVTFYDSMIVNAFVIGTTEIKPEPISEGVWMRDAIQDVLQTAQLFHESQGMNEENYTFPEKLQIVGAVVDPDPDLEGHPKVPLRAFKYYNKVLKHHRTLLGDKYAFLTRDEFKEYISSEATERPAGVPESYTELALVDSYDLNEPRNWSFTLMFADVK